METDPLERQGVNRPMGPADREEAKDAFAARVMKDVDDVKRQVTDLRYRLPTLAEETRTQVTHHFERIEKLADEIELTLRDLEESLAPEWAAERRKVESMMAELRTHFEEARREFPDS